MKNVSNICLRNYDVFVFCRLFNDADNTWNYKPSNDWMAVNKQLETMRKERKCPIIALACGTKER